MLNSGDRPGRLSALAPLSARFSVCYEQTAPNVDVTHVCPASTRQWVELSMTCLQNRKIPLRRMIQVLEDTAQALLDEDLSEEESTVPISADDGTAGAALPVTRSPLRAQANSGKEEIFGDAGGDGKGSHSVAVSPVPATPKRWLAARFLLLGSRLALEQGTDSSLRAAVRLAEAAAATHRSPLIITHLAWACYILSRRVQERGSHNTLERRVCELAVEASEAVKSRLAPSPTDVVLLSNLAWMMALQGEVQKSLSLAQLLLQQNRADANTLLLLSLLFSTTGEYREALEVAYHVEQLHSQYVVGGLVLMKMRYEVNDVKLKRREGIEELLAVLVARVEAAAAAAARYTSQGAASDESTFATESVAAAAALDGRWSSRRQGVSRVAGHWALLAYVALEVGCESIADLAVEAGLEYINAAKGEHRQAFADLICCGARLKIDRIEKLVGALRWRHRAAGIWGPAAELQEVEDESLVQEQRDLLDSSNVLSLQTMLGKALQVCTSHAETYLLLGRLHLLKALKADQTNRLCSTSLVEAAHYFQSAIRCNPTLTDAYEGMGRVREAQGAVEISLSFLSSAAELAYRQPVIPFERFLYFLR